jgi:HSP20 family protein
MNRRTTRMSTPWDLFGDVDRLMSNLFVPMARPARGHGHPAWRVEQLEEGWDLEVDLPGYAREEVTVDVAEGELTVEARRVGVAPEDGSDAPVLREHRLRLTLPDDVDVAAVEGGLADGQLRLHLPRVLPVLPESRRIELV